MPDLTILRIEKQLAAAHKNLWWAWTHAQQLANPGMGDDLWNLLMELEHLQESLLRGPRRP